MLVAVDPVHPGHTADPVPTSIAVEIATGRRDGGIAEGTLLHDRWRRRLVDGRHRSAGLVGARL